MGKWFISLCDAYGNPAGQRLNVTDSVLDTTGEGTAADTSEQEQAASALLESAYGTTDGTMNGIYWFE